ncbi:MAG: SHOCT-like domain-containing protein, partial [Thermoleophilia bacterium]
MNEERTRILEMLAAGKITPQETERLLDALQAAP